MRFARRARVAALLLLLTACGPAAGTAPQITRSASASSQGLHGPLHTQGNRLIDSHGRTVVLRGAQIPGYNVARTYQSTTFLSVAAFHAMHSWAMNELRVPFSGCLVSADSAYLPRLITYVREAEAAGLYVVLALFDDERAGCPAGTVHLPPMSAIAEWEAVGSAFRSDPNVLFDLFNEPSLPSLAADAAWTVWKSGGTVATPLGAFAAAGFDQLAAAVRHSGATTQPLIAEAVNGQPLSGALPHLPDDTNVLFSVHTYFRTDLTSQDWDGLFGTAAATLPVFVGEWALLPNADQPGMCAALHLSTAQATMLVTGFLDYMDARGVSYNAWAFIPTRLIVDEVTFAPTTIPDPMVCSPALTQAGMGALFKAHLQALAAR